MILWNPSDIRCRDNKVRFILTFVDDIMFSLVQNTVVNTISRSCLNESAEWDNEWDAYSLFTTLIMVELFASPK
jgi:hypothetical protein